MVADSITQYHDKESRELSKLAAEANLSVRALGFKPYIAPALSSAAISILLTMRGADHYGSVALHEIYFGCKNKYTKEGWKQSVRNCRDSSMNGSGPPTVNWKKSVITADKRFVIRNR